MSDQQRGAAPQAAAPQSGGRILAKIFLAGVVHTVTGLHVGGNSVSMEIGNVNNVVVRNPLSGHPYLPGSSLRGKMRSLLERMRGPEATAATGGDGGYSWDQAKGALAGQRPDTLLGQLFGVAAEGESQGPTRLTVRDAHLDDDSIRKLNDAPNTDMPMTEVKTEVWIDRITSAANPRQTERVPAGARFNFEMVLTILEGDDQTRLLNLLFEGLQLVEADTLGGNGSRGYGQVKFGCIALTRRTADHYRDNQPAEPLTGFEIPAEFLGDPVG